MVATPSSQPLMTCPWPSVKENGSLLSSELSNFFALLTVDEEPSCVIDRHGLASLRHGSSAGLDVDNAQTAGRGDLAGGQSR